MHENPQLSGSVAFNAPLTPDYPQFYEVAVPADGTTIAAWRGLIQPFLDDETARSVLADIEAGRQLFISEGNIFNSNAISDHWANEYLVDMTIACEVLLCLQPNAYPRCYLLSPRYRHFYADNNIHPHPRFDHCMTYEGTETLPGLCILSAAEFSFSKGQNFFTQFLDQVSQYLAKHLIWLKTRRLYLISERGRGLLKSPQPGEIIADETPVKVRVRTPHGERLCTQAWIGYWPGPRAAAITPLEHLQTIKRNRRCWCGRDRPYGKCHRRDDLAKLSPSERKPFLF